MDCDSTKRNSHLSATDSQRAVEQMRFSNDNANWSSVDSHTRPRPHGLSRPATARRPSMPSLRTMPETSRRDLSSSILLDTTAPVAGTALLRQASPRPPSACPIPAHPTAAAGSITWSCGTSMVQVGPDKLRPDRFRRFRHVHIHSVKRQRMVLLRACRSGQRRKQVRRRIRQWKRRHDLQALVVRWFRERQLHLRRLDNQRQCRCPRAHTYTPGTYAASAREAAPPR